VQNGRDDHQPDCGDIPLESAAIGRLNGDIGQNWSSIPPGTAMDGNQMYETTTRPRVIDGTRRGYFVVAMELIEA
jgi:hypothetical protein